MFLVSWIRQWAIFDHRDTMGASDVWRWLRQWVPFGLRCVFWCSLSVIIGLLTPRRQGSTWAMRRWARSCLRGLGIRVTVTGEENVPEGVFVYCSNHQSLLDTLTHSGYLPGEFKWVVKHSLLNVPFLGWHLRVAQSVPVERGRGREAALATIDRFVKVLGQGYALLIFPEGTRSPDGEVRQFKDGGFVAAVRAGVPVVPVALEGAGSIMGKGAPDTGASLENEQWERRRVRVQIGSAIVAHSEGEETDRVTELRERTRGIIIAMQRALKAEMASSGGDVDTQRSNSVCWDDEP